MVKQLELFKSQISRLQNCLDGDLNKTTDFTAGIPVEGIRSFIYLYKFLVNTLLSFRKNLAASLWK